jgi:hypothetical protein
MIIGDVNRPYRTGATTSKESRQQGGKSTTGRKAEMKNLVLKHVIRALFFFTTRERTHKQTHKVLSHYIALSGRIPPEYGSLPVTVPPMRGVDENMRHWSFYQILSHNVLVNRSIAATVEQLANGESLHGAAAIDPKSDVMPSPEVGEEQVSLFRNSVLDHMDSVANLGNLRRTSCSPHPVFGNFNAHHWNCMFPFHLNLHYPQALYVAQNVKNGETLQ